MRYPVWALGLCALAASGTALAQPYPNRPVTLMVPYAAGGTTDVLARIIGKSMGAQLGQTMIVENVSGAGGTTGTQRVIRSEPDGYTLTFGNLGSLAANALLYPNIPFDPRKDLIPIGLVATVPVVLSASKKSGVRDMAGMLAKLREKENGVNFGTAGAGSTTHLAASLFTTVTGTKATFVNYRGSGPAIADLVAGVVDAGFDQTVTMIPMHTGGNVTAIAVSGPVRMSQMPEIPTFAEAGVPDFQLSVWNAIAAPPATPPAVVARLEAALAAALDDPETKKRFTELASVAPVGDERGGAALGKLFAAELDRLGGVVRAAGIKPD